MLWRFSCAFNFFREYLSLLYSLLVKCGFVTFGCVFKKIFNLFAGSHLDYSDCNWWQFYFICRQWGSWICSEAYSSSGCSLRKWGIKSSRRIFQWVGRCVLIVVMFFIYARSLLVHLSIPLFLPMKLIKLPLGNSMVMLDLGL